MLMAWRCDVKCMITASCHLLIRLGQNAGMLGRSVHVIGDFLAPSLRLMIPIDIHIIALSASVAHDLHSPVCI